MKRFHMAGWWLASLLLVAMAMGAATDNFATFQPNLLAPCTDTFACVQHDTDDLTRVPRLIRFDAAGDVKLEFADGSQATFTVLPGETLPLRPVAVVIALVQGGVQSQSRALFARLIPPEHAGEYFGFYNMLGKFAVILGPILVGWAAVVLNDPRQSLMVLLLLFVPGALLLWRVPQPR